MEYYNTILIVVGSIIALVTLFTFIMVIKKENQNDEELLISQYENNVSKSNNAFSDIEYADINKKLKNINKDIIDIKKDIIDIKKDLKYFFDSLKEEKLKENEIIDNNSDSFKHLLNYNQFITKNKDIIELNKAGKTYEEIAKHLNKSIREVEMICKLTK